MRGNTTLIAILFVIIIVIFGYVYINQSGNDEFGEGVPQQNVGDVVPDFTLESHSGEEVSPSDFEGKVLVINSWATWCPFCVDELPDFAELQQEFGDEIAVIAVNRGEELDRAQSYVENIGIENGMTYLLDPKDSFYASIGGFSMPETIFVDENGKIDFHKRGPMSLDEMRNRVNDILGVEG